MSIKARRAGAPVDEDELHRMAGGAADLGALGAEKLDVLFGARHSEEAFSGIKEGNLHSYQCLITMSIFLALFA